LVGGRAPIGGGGLIRLLTLIPDAESPRFLLSTTPDGAIGTHVRGGGVIVGLAVLSGDIVLDIEGNNVIVGVIDIEGVLERVADDVIDGESISDDVVDVV
jgi:hypothetical protein